MLKSATVRPNAWLPTVMSGLSAGGSTQATATAVPSSQDCSVFTTVAAGQGCSLPGVGLSSGEVYTVVNHGASALSVYPAVNGYIGTAAQNGAYSLAAGSAVSFLYVGLGRWCVGV